MKNIWMIIVHCHSISVSVGNPWKAEQTNWRPAGTSYTFALSSDLWAADQWNVDCNRYVPFLTFITLLSPLKRVNWEHFVALLLDWQQSLREYPSHLSGQLFRFHCSRKNEKPQPGESLNSWDLLAVLSLSFGLSFLGWDIDLLRQLVWAGPFPFSSSSSPAAI